MKHEKAKRAPKTYFIDILFAVYILVSVYSSSALAVEPSSTESHSSPTSSEQVMAIIEKKVIDLQWLASHPKIINAVRAQNDVELSQKDIEQRDSKWQTTDDNDEFKLSLQSSDAGSFLRHIVNSGKVYSEIFVTDKRGANVAAFPATSDYYQADEEKWQKAFSGGEGQLYVGPAQYDDSTKVKAVQVSLPVLSNDEVIGVLIAGIRLTYLEYKALKLSKKSGFVKRKR